MRQNQNTTSSLSFRLKNAVVLTTVFSIVTHTIASTDQIACSHLEGDNECELDITVQEYRGNPRSIATWKDRGPRHASRLREITSSPVLEFVIFLKRSPEFQVILDRLESDRRQSYSRKDRKTFIADPKGKYIRETGIALWIPKDSRKLGVYTQRSGETYFYSNYGTRASQFLEARSQVRRFSYEASFHLLIHTHPWGTVPSNHDLATARRGVISIVLSEMNGEPTAYVFSEVGSVWELPTRLFRSNAAKEAPVLVSKN